MGEQKLEVKGLEGNGKGLLLEVDLHKSLGRGSHQLSLPGTVTKHREGKKGLSLLLEQLA